MTVRVRSEIGFMNDKAPEFFKKQPVYVCLMAELSDGHLLHFARIRYAQFNTIRNMQLTNRSAKKLNKGQEVMFEAKLTHASQTVRAYVMCDLIGMSIHPLRKSILLT